MKNTKDKKYRIRYENSNWLGTYDQIVKWAREKCYNEFQRNRQMAAQLLFYDPEFVG